MFSMLTLVLADNFLLMLSLGRRGSARIPHWYYIDRREAGTRRRKRSSQTASVIGFVIGIMLVFFLTSQAGAPSISFCEGRVSRYQRAGDHWWHGRGAVRVAYALEGRYYDYRYLSFHRRRRQERANPLMSGCLTRWPVPRRICPNSCATCDCRLYMIVRCSAIYTHARTAMFIVAIIGAATALSPPRLD